MSDSRYPVDFVGKTVASYEQSDWHITVVFTDGTRLKIGGTHLGEVWDEVDFVDTESKEVLS